ncbi:MAG: hypothetical protein ACI86H_002418 [bacterium]|jgi:hypothetical protein
MSEKADYMELKIKALILVLCLISIKTNTFIFIYSSLIQEDRFELKEEINA